MDSAPLMSSFVKLLVSDTERSTRFYEALGFKRVAAEPPFLRLQWEAQAEVYLVAQPTGLPMEGRRGTGVLLGFRIGALGLEEVATRARTHGASVDGPTVQPWFTREIIVTDPDGYRLNFIEPA